MSREEYPSYPVKASGGATEKGLSSHAPFLDVAPIRTFFYSIAWWSYILVADACVWRRCESSLMRSRPREFWFPEFWTIPL
jgi:hypothetical protein